MKTSRQSSKKNSFVRFLEEIDDTKNHFEIIGPLITVKNLSNDKVVMVKTPLQITCDILKKAHQIMSIAHFASHIRNDSNFVRWRGILSITLVTFMI